MANAQEALDKARLHKLAGVHPQLADVVRRIVIAMDCLGFRMIVTDGVRTTAEQKALFAKGRSTPGPNVKPGRPLGDTVTNADGVVKRSNHQTHADALGHAVDMTFMDDAGTPLDPSDDKPTWDEKRFPFRLYGEMAKSLGCTWGGDWKSIHDLPHIELPGGTPGTGAGQ